MQESNSIKIALQQSLKELQHLKQNTNIHHKEPVAIISAGLNFPCSIKSLDNYWQMLINAETCVTEMTNERWNKDEFYDSNPEAKGKIYSNHLGLVNDIDKFDADLFGITPRELIHIDPQHRILLEVCWEALENAGYSPLSLKNSKTGVFIGIMSDDYGQLQGGYAGVNAHVGSGTSRSIAAGRISYTFGFQGPCMAIDTACSSSLVALHLAVQSLRMQESNMCIAGGVNLILSPLSSIVACKSKMLSAEGKCRPFDKQANGYVRSEGCGVVILKRLSDAIKAKDPILAVIRGTAINQDGRSQGITAPNGQSQRKVIQESLENAGVKPEEVAYVECHCTGTPLGDPIEVQALKAIYCKNRSHPIMIGAVKSNMGHMEAAAGIAGLLKLILVLNKRQVPPTLHFSQLNPYLNVNENDINIVTTTSPLDSDSSIGAVSSFGFSGTNVHVILEAPTLQRSNHNQSAAKWHIMKLSAASQSALINLAKSYLDFSNNNEACLNDIAFSTNQGRADLTFRNSIIFKTMAEYRQSLVTFIDNCKPNQLIPVSRQHSIHFMFAHSNTRYAGMGKDLYSNYREFQDAIIECEQILWPLLNIKLTELLWGIHSDKLVYEIYGIPATVAYQYALAKIWCFWNIKPDVITGLGSGEYSAAVIAKIFTISDALKLASIDGKITQSTSVEEKHTLLLKLRSLAATITYHDCSVPIRHNFDEINPHDDNITSSNYWIKKIEFCNHSDLSCKLISEEPHTIYIEIGPDNSRQDTKIKQDDSIWVASQLKDQAQERCILEALHRLYGKGCNPDWDKFNLDFPGNRVLLPTYPFDKQSYWSVGLSSNHENVYSNNKSANFLSKEEAVSFKSNLLTEFDKLVKGNSTEDYKTIKDKLDLLCQQFIDNIFQAQPAELTAKLLSDRITTMKKNKPTFLEVKNEAKQILSKIINVTSHKISDTLNFSSMGIDSLIAMEYEKILRSIFNVTIPVSLLLGDTNLNILAEYIFSNSPLAKINNISNQEAMHSALEQRQADEDKLTNIVEFEL